MKHKIILLAIAAFAALEVSAARPRLVVNIVVGSMRAEDLSRYADNYGEGGLRRLIEDGRFGSNTMKLMVSQNAPFVPMYDAWQAGSRKMLAYEDDKARRDAEIIDAKVLSNRRPPYGITGGLYDALKATGGEFFVATNAMARKARKLFKELEGVDIYSASGIALASLVNAVAAGKIEKDAVVMLNITGGGEEHFKEDKELWYLKPSHVFPLEPDTDDVVAKVEALFAKNIAE